MDKFAPSVFAGSGFCVFSPMKRGVRGARIGPGVAGLLLSGLAFSQVALAQAFVPLKGDGSWAVAIQSISVVDHTDYQGNAVDAGRIDSRSLYLQLEYGLTNRLAITVGIPYIQAKYEGDRPHEPDEFPDHVGEAVVDDGRWHGGMQDFNLGLRYNVWTRPLMVTPFVALSYPSHDYTYFAHSAIGTQQWQVEFGADMAKQLPQPLDMFYVQGGYGYSIKEKVQDISIKASRIDLELGYFVTPRLTARLLGVWQKSHNGLNFPVDFPPPPSELRFDHDRVQRIDYLNAGAGLRFEVSDHYALFGTWITHVQGENGHAILNAFIVGINRSFSRASQVY